jgi:hypothetical protein
MKYLLALYFIVISFIVLYRYKLEYLEGFKEKCVVNGIANNSKCNAGEVCYMIGSNSMENECISKNSISSGYCRTHDACLSGLCDISKNACVPLFPSPLEFKRVPRVNCTF